MFSKIYNNENKTELIKVDDKFNIKNIKKIVKQLNNTIDFNIPDKREYDLEIKKLEIQEIEANNKTMEEKTKQMSIELEFKKLELPKLELQHPKPDDKLTQELKEKITKLTEELTELKEWKAHRLIKNRGMKEQAEKNKEKFVNWLKSNLINQTGSFFKMEELMIKFLGRNTSTPIIKIYRSYLEEYIKEKYPDIRSTYIQKVKIGRIYMDLRLK